MFYLYYLMCAKLKICVQNESFVCKAGACVQSVCRFVQNVCSQKRLCAIYNYLIINEK